MESIFFTEKANLIKEARRNQKAVKSALTQINNLNKYISDVKGSITSPESEMILDVIERKTASIKSALNTASFSYAVVYDNS